MCSASDRRPLSLGQLGFPADGRWKDALREAVLLAWARSLPWERTNVHRLADAAGGCPSRLVTVRAVGSHSLPALELGNVVINVIFEEAEEECTERNGEGVPQRVSVQ